MIIPKDKQLHILAGGIFALYPARGDLAVVIRGEVRLLNKPEALQLLARHYVK